MSLKTQYVVNRQAICRRIQRFWCWFGLHDWRYASNYRRGGRMDGTPKQISRARCQHCDARQWELDESV